MKKIIYLFFTLFIGTGILTAQTYQVSGRVISAEDGEPIPGATIRVKGSNFGTVSDVNGNFSFHVPDTSRTLLVTFVGKKASEAPITPMMQIVLYSETHNLNETVVTALGIRRSWKSLGYASSVVSGDELSRAREDNLLNALAGKVAGVRIAQSSGAIGGSARIQIRGASSIVSPSSPLFVIDGMPIDNSTYNPDNYSGYIDAGNRVGDISLDNIESVNVLKGAAAAALYGARAKDGAVIITTKRGSRNAKMSVIVNSSTRFEKISRLPDYQNEYAQGTGGEYAVKALTGWGPNIAESRAAGTKYVNFAGEETLLEAYPDNVKDFFETGTTYINNIALSGGNQTTDFHAGISSFNQKGIIPGSDYNRYTFSVNAGTDLVKGLLARFTVQYIRNDSKGRSAQGINDVNGLMSIVYLLPRTMDIHYLKNNWIQDNGEQKPMAPETKINNPYWLTHKNQFTGSLDRLVGNVLLNYSPLEGLTISNNFGMDYYSEARRKIYAKGTIGELNGKFQDVGNANRLINNDLIVTYEKSWNDFTFKSIAGHNLQQDEWSSNTVLASGLIVEDLYNYANAEQTSSTNYFQRKRLTGIYFDLGIGYKSIAFLNVTGRNDWSSTLPANQRSYFYPSVSGSFVFSELLPDQHVLDFGTLRINYANVGSDTDPYQLKYQYTPASKYSTLYTDQVFPHNGLIGFYGPMTLPLENLKPQNQRAFEIGAELMFFSSRIHIDATYYKNVTTNQIVAVSVPMSTGYTGNRINAGKLTNKGLEIALGITPLKFKNFEWNVDVNFAKNKQVVNEITNDLTSYNLTASLDNILVGAEVGKSFGIYGATWSRDEAGNYIINKATGLRETSSGRLGDIYPDFTMGISNHFNYKGFDLSFLIDVRHGGKLFSGTVGVLRSAGLVKETLAHRGETFIEPGVIIGDDGSSRPNDMPVKDMETYWGHIGNSTNAEGSIFDASYAKLRELTFSYQLPERWFSNVFIRSLQIGFEGRNLWLIRSHVPHIDPEVNLYGPSSIGEGLEYYNLPSTRSFGFNIRLSI